MLSGMWDMRSYLSAPYGPDQASQHPAGLVDSLRKMIRLHLKTKVPAKKRVVPELFKRTLGNIVKMLLVGRASPFESFGNVARHGHGRPPHL